MSTYRLLFSLALLMCLCSTLLTAQTETGQLTGTVFDPAGAVLPKATITVTDPVTKAARTATSSAAGSYVIPSLLPGTYEVSATAPGFQTTKQNVTVTVGARVGLDLHLTIGTTSTVVEVTENVTQVNTETQTLSQNVSGAEVLELPTLTRNPYALVTSVGNVSEGDPGGRGAGVAINGQRATSTNLLLDGVPNNSEFSGDIGIRIPLDSVGEFSVLTSNFTAEFGRASGGVINVATRNGTNALHGTVYEFNRVSDLASNTFDNNANGIPKSVFVRNQFGYSIGGPIIKNKLFFFENTEWIRIRSEGEQTAAVATPQLIAASAANTQAFFKTFGTLKPTDRVLQTFTRGQVCTTGACTAIPASTPIYQKVAFNVPSDSGGGDPENTWLLVGRLDYNLGDKTQMYFRYAHYDRAAFAGTQTFSPYVGYDTGYFDLNSAYALSVTRIFSPQWVSQTKLSYNRISNTQPLGTPPIAPTLYTNLNTTGALGNANINYPGYSPNTPGNSIPFGGPQNFFTLNEDVSYSRGSHNFRFGGLYTYFQDNRTFGAYEEAVEALGTNTANAVNGLITGQLHDFQAAIYPQGKFPCINKVTTAACTLTLPVGPPNFSRSNRFHEAALYAQDSWKVRPRFTVNLGVRWEYYGPQANTTQQLDSNFYLGSGPNIEIQSGNGQILVAPNSPVGGLWAKNWTNFAPRVGFAWDVFGNQKTSLRGGYGIAYERNFNNVTFNVIQNPPAYSVIALTAGIDVPTIPLTNDNAGPLAGTSGTKAFPGGSVRAVNPHIKTAYAHEWSLALEHQFSSDLLIGLEYAGNTGRNLYTIDRLNMGGSQIVYTGTGTASARINKQYTLINFRTNGGDSLYNGLNTRVELRNFRRQGLTLRANYTWAHSIDDGSSTFTSDLSGQPNLGQLDPLNPALDRGDSDFDIRHRVSIAAVWDIPTHLKGAANMIAGGWSIAPIFTAHTGTPFTVWDCNNEASALCPRVMFDKQFHATYTNTGSGPNQFNYLDLSAADSSYANPLTGSSDFGPFPATMTGRNVFRAPGVWTTILAVHKNFRVTERVSLQLRGEVFNVFNHSNLYPVYGNRDISNFTGPAIIATTRGQRNDSTAYSSSVENGRIENRNLQLALKVIF